MPLSSYFIDKKAETEKSYAQGQLVNEVSHIGSWVQAPNLYIIVPLQRP